MKCPDGSCLRSICTFRSTPLYLLFCFWNLWRSVRRPNCTKWWFIRCPSCWFVRSPLFGNLILQRCHSSHGFRDVINVLITNLVYLALISLFYWLILYSSLKPQFIIGKSVILVHFLFNMLVMIFLRILYKGIYENYIGGGKPRRRVMIYGAEIRVWLHTKYWTKKTETGLLFWIHWRQYKKKKRKLTDWKSTIRIGRCRISQKKRNFGNHYIDSKSEFVRTQPNNRPVFWGFRRTEKVPAVRKWLNGDLSLRQIKSVNIDDFLGREPINLDSKEIFNEVRGKNTGYRAAGSIGSEISRQLMVCPVEQPVLLWSGGIRSLWSAAVHTESVQ